MGLFSDHKAKKEGMHEGMEGMGGAHSCCGGHTANGNQSAPAKGSGLRHEAWIRPPLQPPENTMAPPTICNPGCAAKFEQNPTQYLA